MSRRVVRSVSVIVAMAAALIIGTSPSAAGRPQTRLAPPRSVRWLAVGDSYSSGEGLPDVSEPTCQRADLAGGHTSAAYAVTAHALLDSQTLPVAADSVGRKGFDFEACTGAVTEDLFNDNNGKKEWDPNNNGRFDLVTFSFGGNNVGFKAILYKCLGISVQGAAAGAISIAGGGFIKPIETWLALVGCPSEKDMRADVDNLTLGGADEHGNPIRPLAQFYQQVAADVVTPGGNVIVVGYPELIEDPQFWPTFNQAVGACQGIRKRDALAIRGLAGYLNQTIGQAVADANNNPYGVHFTFVDVNTGQPDHGVQLDDSRLFEPSTGKRHNLCAANPWLNGIVVGGAEKRSRSFHPTQAGYDNEGNLLADRIRTLEWSIRAQPGCDLGTIQDDIGQAFFYPPNCYGDWALGFLGDCGDQCESIDIFHFESGHWKYLGGFYSICAAGMTASGLPIAIAQQYAPPGVFCNDAINYVDEPPTGPLATGMRGPRVIALQQALIDAGSLELAADGAYGPGTSGAVIAVQAENGLDVDGIAGPEVFAALGIPYP